MLLSTDWRRCHRRLDFLLASLRIRPLRPASSAHLYTDILCLLADLLGAEDQYPGIPVATRTG
jgi:hypothetical protein